MPTLTITKSYDDATTLTEAQLDDIKTSIETFVNTTKLDSSNLQADAVTSTQLAAGSVTTAKIAAGAVGTAALASSAVTTATIADSNITTGKIAANAVTRAKLESVGQQVSSSSGTFTTTSTSATDVTNLSVTITTTGRPVKIEFKAIGSGAQDGYIGGNSGGGSGGEIYFKLLRDATTVSYSNITFSSFTAFQPAASLNSWDIPAAGTYTYKLQCHVYSGTQTAHVNKIYMMVYEI